MLLRILDAIKKDSYICVLDLKGKEYTSEEFSKKIDNTSVRVCFAEDGESCMSVSDFRNLGYQYLKFTGETGFFECQNCGLIYKDKNQGRVRPRKYCSDCALEIHIKQTVNSVMNRRYRS